MIASQMKGEKRRYFVKRACCTTCHLLASFTQQRYKPPQIGNLIRINGRGK